ncbi:2'-5' RNA ligase family protein [Streptomyces sp. TRM49041]|uniref:2'-5' RNA ligase family protein n=1 Tax=Streptomyces sp. TRM49041 TaxID=2603216 RepID=UPI0021CCA81D|nr:2'-5' RNA ligase family protein [Streptomyces sp. TRM49041]
MTTNSMANHWWWRPGWREGRSFYTWHLTFRDAPAVHHLADSYRHALGDVPGLDLVPDQWLHLTLQGLGFTDEVADKDRDAVVDAATARLRSSGAFELALHRPEITPEAIRWEAQPAEPVSAVRDAVRAAIGDVWSQVPEKPDGFAPHVTIAYSNSDGPDGPARKALDSVDAAPVLARVRAVELIVLNRDKRMYQWETLARVPLD